MVPICEQCRARHKEALEQANEHLDAKGVPEDSLVRGFMDLHLACNEHPGLEMLILEMYPYPASLAQ